MRGDTGRKRRSKKGGGEGGDGEGRGGREVEEREEERKVDIVDRYSSRITANTVKYQLE